MATPAERRALHEQNRRSWNHATRAHNSHKGNQAKFLREGGSTLFLEEIELLGDLAGRALVHLQCNAGQDTLSLARLGATVTGVDISDEAVEFARRLSRESGIAATFERADVYDWLDETAASRRRFDLVFSSYGAIVWLSDLAAWARGIASILKPGGRFVLVDFHPAATMFDENWQRVWDYSGGGKPEPWAGGIGDYVAMAREGLVPWGYEEGVQDFKNPEPVNEFAWGIADVLTAFLDAGMVIEAFREYPYANGAKQWNGLRELPGRRFTVPGGTPNLPLMFGLAARKPA